jgi:hypothetical protein
MSIFKSCKMKKTILVIVTGFLIMASLSSCTQGEDIPEFMLQESQACCGEEGGVDPPPPPLPPPGDGLGG